MLLYFYGMFNAFERTSTKNMEAQTQIKIIGENFYIYC